MASYSADVANDAIRLCSVLNIVLIFEDADEAPIFWDFNLQTSLAPEIHI